MDALPTNRYSTLAARVYHLDKPIGRSFGDVEFYSNYLSTIDGEVFEPAAGTGRILVPLREQGIRISGSDPSPEMLGICADELERRGLDADLSRGTFSSIPQGSGFAAVIIPAGSIQLLTDLQGVENALTSIRASLKAGGELIFDLDPFVSLNSNEPYSKYWRDGEEIITMTSTPESTDFVSQVTISQLRYEVWGAGVLKQTELDRFALRFWTVNEIRLALLNSGFGNIQLISDYERGKTVTNDSRSITVIAKK